MKKLLLILICISLYACQKEEPTLPQNVINTPIKATNVTYQDLIGSWKETGWVIDLNGDTIRPMIYFRADSTIEFSFQCSNIGKCKLSNDSLYTYWNTPGQCNRVNMKYSDLKISNDTLYGKKANAKYVTICFR